ncbi:MAG: serine/threonine protein kinase, partial [Myxococcales bacterium]|nr:serine/threonine protein kinase [Myxococcales bacterium]
MSVDPDDPRCGAPVAEGLVVLGRLGAGGMGVVYRAWQRSMGRQVALKVLDPGLAHDPRAVERFLREARVTARLRSPHTVTVLDAGQLDDGALFLTMELIEGRSLHALLNEDGRLPPDRAARLAEQICLSLEEAHLAGVVHRDLKPANVMVSSIGNRTLVKVLDFGVARVLDPMAARLTETGSLLGTPSYMSPEQASLQS